MRPALKASQERIREANYRQILHALMRRREMSKQEMAKETGLSVPTVTVCVARMLQQGVAAEQGEWPLGRSGSSRTAKINSESRACSIRPSTRSKGTRPRSRVPS